MDSGVVVFVGIPVAIVLVVAVGIFVKRGVGAGILAFVLGLVAVALLVVALLVFYYASGGH
jgi:hypothetical protein